MQEQEFSPHVFSQQQDLERFLVHKALEDVSCHFTNMLIHFPSCDTAALFRTKV